MTAIVGVLNSQAVAIAADSAATVSGKNGTKVYNRSNKIFTLSKFHPVGIAIYNSANFLGLPLETLIKMYRDKLKDTAFDTVQEYKQDFLDFIKLQVKHISRDYKGDAFYGFCSDTYREFINEMSEFLNNQQATFAGQAAAVTEQAIDQELTNKLQERQKLIAGLPQANYIALTVADFEVYYRNELSLIRQHIESELQKVNPLTSFKAHHAQSFVDMFYALINVEFIFEQYCGLVFIGFGEEEVYPSSHLVLLGTLIADHPRIRVFDAQPISPPVFPSRIIPYVQGDVTFAVLTGVDPNYKNEVVNSVQSAFSNIAREVALQIGDPVRAAAVSTAITDIEARLLQGLDEYQNDQITGPLLDILAHMGKEDMSELAESLVNITSLKRKFSAPNSTDESVGGPVDVAIITKGDGFIWMKRKQYFKFEDNRGFVEKYFNK